MLFQEDLIIILCAAIGYFIGLIIYEGDIIS